MSAATVYRVLPDIDKYQYIESDDHYFDFDGTSKLDSWREIKVHSPYPLRPAPDVWGGFSTAGAFAVTMPVFDKIGEFLLQSCEMLSVSLNGEKMLVANVIEVIDCLDVERSEFPADLPHMITRFAFNSRRFNWSLFKVPQVRMSHILCVERGDCDFKACVEALNLCGLRFVKLWSDQ